LLSLIVIPREVNLVLGKPITSVVGYKALRGISVDILQHCRLDTYLGVNKPEAPSSLVFSQALLNEVLDNLLGNPDASTSSSHEYSAMILDRLSGAL
jgi:hypothetical protein